AFQGFYLALSGQAVNVTFNPDDRATPVPDDFRYDEWGGGTDLAIGYAFSPIFSWELGGSASVFDAHPKNTNVVSLDARITGYLSFLPEWRVHPVLIGGVGVSAFGWFGDDFTDRLYASGRGDLGAGLRFRVSRRFVVRADFIYSTHDVEREVLDLEDEGDADLRHVDGSAFSRTVRVGLAWDF
ncbi:MAG: porin family protein, partial [Phycisphaeraceae bacterium]|nr:porin family protein [Phycisphaeraceae bacterium]